MYPYAEIVAGNYLEYTPGLGSQKKIIAPEYPSAPRYDDDPKHYMSSLNISGFKARGL